MSRLLNDPSLPFREKRNKNFGEVSLHWNGNVYGNVQVYEALPHPTTVSRHLQKVVTCVWEKVVLQVSPDLNSRSCASMSDMWSDLKGLSYISMTIHFINCDWELQQKTTLQLPFPGWALHGRKKSSRVPASLCQKRLYIRTNLITWTFFTDRRANIIKAIENYKRLDCFDHVVNTVLKYTFDSTFD